MATMDNHFDQCTNNRGYDNYGNVRRQSGGGGGGGGQYDSHRGSVGFSAGKKDSEYRQKILTMKYGSHQMKLIRKRLAIEDWLEKQLRVLYRCKNQTDDYDTEIDLDEVLDLDTLPERQQFLRAKVSNAKQTPDVVNTFIEELLLKVDTL